MSIPRALVYFAYLGDEATESDLVGQRLAFATRQMRWIAELLAVSKTETRVLVPYVAPCAWDGAVRQAVESFGFSVDPASIADERRNTFEYPGFRALKSIAEAGRPDAFIYYCHSKGIVHLEESKMGLFRFHTRIGLTMDLSGFAEDPALTRAALFPARFGWCWYNFFWVKANYMAGKSVRENDDRYEFEALIGERGNKEAYRGVLPLIGQVPLAETGIVEKPWYRPEETSSSELFASYDRYARMASPAEAGDAVLNLHAP